MGYRTAATAAVALALVAEWPISTEQPHAEVQVEPQNYTADYRAKGASPRFVDTVHYQRLAP